ncbi:MAG: hypothetical protein H8F28_28100 [Fibrella sp.]|nr:hypothetical protein [Armatimonadota bacterium]
MRETRITDPVIGELKWEGDRWTGELRLSPRRKTEINISVPDDSEEVPDAARERFAWIMANEKRLRLAVAERMRGDVWSDDPEDTSLSAEQFAERIVAENIDLLAEPKSSEEGAIDFSMWYDDDMLFGGHVLISDFTKDGELLKVEVHG